MQFDDKGWSQHHKTQLMINDACLFSKVTEQYCGEQKAKQE